MKLRIGCVCIIFIILNINARAQVGVGDKGTLSGLVFGDYYWFAQSHDSDIEGNNGFWFRRIYLTYEHTINDSFSSRLRLEMGSPGDFSTDSGMTPVVKDAYLQWANEHHKILAGISSTPTFGLLENVWGYRSVEKAPQDLYGLGSSRDFGISFKGKLGSERRVGYHLFAGNGNSNKAELNKGKKAMLALSYLLTDRFVIEAYGDWENRTGDSERMTIQGFAGYRSKTFNLGALYAYQFRDNSNSTIEDRKLDLISLFTNMKLTDNLKGFIRFDHRFDPAVNGESISYLPMSSDAESSTFFVGGMDILLDENIQLMPNIEAVVYGEDGAGNRPETDIVPRLTLFYKF